MKTLLSITYLFLFVFTAKAQTNKHLGIDLNKKYILQLDSLFQSLITHKKSAGLMMGIQNNDAKPYFKEYGFSDLQAGKTIDRNNTFRIASVTKPFTAVAIMSLVEKGKLSLSYKLSKFFKDFPNADKITIYHLLSHTSGIPNWWEGGMPSNEPKDFPMCKNPHLYLEKMKNTSFFEPGTKHYYSNSGYVLLGEIIEIVSGMDYENYLKLSIFMKAGMLNTMVENAQNRNVNWVKGYKQNSPTDTTFLAPDEYAMPFSAGSLRSNSLDMFRFLNALYEGNLIKLSTLKTITDYATTNSGLPVYDAMYFPKEFSPPNPPDYIKKYGYGLGFSLMEIYKTPVVWHSGGIAGFNSILMYIPKSKTKIILLSNTENGIMPIWEEIQKIIVKFE
jgi:D-alanyl-D-alanine carboxypeptidase